MKAMYLQLWNVSVQTYEHCCIVHCTALEECEKM